MPVEVQIALAVAGAVGGYASDRKARKQQKSLQTQAVKREREAQEKQDKIASIKNLAERRSIFQRQRIALAQNISAQAQGEGGLAGSTLSAANSALQTGTNAQIGRINATETLGTQRNSLLQNAADLRGQASQVSNPSGFLFSVAQQMAPTGQQFQDFFTNSPLFKSTP